MSDSGQNHTCNCCHQESDDAILESQARACLNQAADWFNAGRLEAAEILGVAARKLLSLSDTNQRLWKRYFTLQAGIAQGRGRNKAALGHARRAYRLSRQIYADGGYQLGVDECNLGECLALAGRPEAGVRLLAQGLERIRAHDFKDNERKVEWQKGIVKSVSSMIADLTRG